MGKTIRLTRFQILSMFRRPIWWILLAFGTAFSLGCFIYVYNKDPFIAVSQMSYGQAIITIVIMMIGIEIRREQRNEFLYVSAVNDSCGANVSCCIHFICGNNSDRTGLLDNNGIGYGPMDMGVKESKYDCSF